MFQFFCIVLLDDVLVLDEIMSSRPASGSSTPSILRNRKRSLPVERAKEPIPTKQPARKSTVGDDYIKKLAEEAALSDNKHMLYGRRINVEEQSEHAVKERCVSLSCPLEFLPPHFCDRVSLD